MTLVLDCGLEIWEINCVLRENYVAGTADRAIEERYSYA